jgi:hypothetical protein
VKKTPLRPSKKKIPRYKAPKRRRRTSEEYDRLYGSPARAKAIRMSPCCHCGRQPTEDFQNVCHHTQREGTGRKAGWATVVPMCNTCHRAWHWLGSNERFLEVTGVDVVAIAARLAEEIQP